MNRRQDAGLGAGLALPAFAKINRGLRLLGRRADGYHELRTVYQTVTLHDRLRLRLARAGDGIVVRVPGGGAPSGRQNLVYRILGRARRALGLRRGIEVELEKNIPAAHGLGGGSSDAAAALLGLLRLTRTRLTRDELAGLGAAIGADVPFFFVGGRALGVGRGEEVYELDEAPPAWCVLLCPLWPVPTRAAYRWAAARLTPRRRAHKILRRRVPLDDPPTLKLRGAGLWSAGNDFEPVIFSRFPELGRMKAALLRAGASEAGLSGSGSTVYALFTHRVAAERAAARWASRAAAVVVETLSRARYRRALGWEQAVRRPE